MRKMERWAIGLMLASLPGCISVFGSKDEAIRVETDPPGAHVSVNQQEPLVSPVDIVIPRRDGLLLDIHKEGWQPRLIEVDSTVRLELLWNLGLLYFFPLGAGVDLMTGAGLERRTASLLVKLEPANGVPVGEPVKEAWPPSPTVSKPVETTGPPAPDNGQNPPPAPPNPAFERWARVPVQGAAYGGAVGLGLGIVVGQTFGYVQWAGAKSDCLNRYTADDIRGMVETYRGQSRYCEDYATRESHVRYTRAFYPVLGASIGMAAGMLVEHAATFPDEPRLGQGMLLAAATVGADRAALGLWRNKPDWNGGALVLALAGPWAGYYLSETLREAFFSGNRDASVVLIPATPPSEVQSSAPGWGMSLAIQF